MIKAEPEFLDYEDKVIAYNGKDVFEAEAWPGEEIVNNEEDADLILADKENSSKHPSLQSSPKVGIDRLCSSSNTVNGVCTIKDKTLRFSTDLHYNTDISIVLDNTKLKCLTIAYSPCSFMVSMLGKKGTQLILKNGSTITGKQIIIGAPHTEVVISDDSSLWASGQSIMTQGTQNASVGAAFIAQAGYCGGIPGFKKERQPTYGFFSRMPEKKDLSKFEDEIGSIGKINDVETAGGGRIVMYADSVTFEGAGAKI